MSTLKEDVVDFFVLDLLPKCKEGTVKNKVEEFKVQEGLKPTGMILIVMDKTVMLVDFDQGQDRKECTAHV